MARTRTLERRIRPLADVEVRADGDKLTFSGYAAVFNELSEDLGGFREQIEPGAFTKTLQEKADVKLLVNHNPDLLLARSASSTLDLAEDQRGLLVTAEMAPTTLGRDLSTLIERGDVDQMSFGFQTVKDEWDESTTPPTRTLREVKLFDVSIVAFPAYPQTSAEVRDNETSEDGTSDEAVVIRAGDVLRALRHSYTPAAYAELLTELREGKILSRKNRDLVEAAIEALRQLLKAAEPKDPDEGKSLPLDLAKRRLRIAEAELDQEETDEPE